MARKIQTKDMIKITNGKQPLSLKLRSGYVNLLPKESLLIEESSLTDDVKSKKRSGWIKVEITSIVLPQMSIVNKEEDTKS